MGESEQELLDIGRYQQGWEKCSVCGNLYDPSNIRETHPYRHPVNGSIPKKDKDKLPGEEPSMHTRVQQLPSDPVLRFALIQAGVIQPEDLRNAEQMLAATGVIATDTGDTSERPQDVEDVREAAAEWGREFNRNRGATADTDHTSDTSRMSAGVADVMG